VNLCYNSFPQTGQCNFPNRLPKSGMEMFFSQLVTNSEAFVRKLYSVDWKMFRFRISGLDSQNSIVMSAGMSCSVKSHHAAEACTPSVMQRELARVLVRVCVCVCVCECVFPPLSPPSLQKVCDAQSVRLLQKICDAQ
jgi:hypothetical protein